MSMKKMTKQIDETRNKLDKARDAQDKVTRLQERGVTGKELDDALDASAAAHRALPWYLR